MQAKYKKSTAVTALFLQKLKRGLIMEKLILLIVFLVGVIAGFYLFRTVFRWRLGSAALQMDLFWKEITLLNPKEESSLEQKVAWLLRRQIDIALILNSIIRDENRNS